MTDLDKLIEAVEAGREWHTISGSLVASVIGLDNVRHFAAAASDDLNAVYALHKAVLPGWRVCDFQQGYKSQRWFIEIDPPEALPTVEAMADTPTRAWLLAILRAMKEQETA